MLPKNIFVLLFCAFMLSACSIFQASGDWSEQMPSQYHFVDYYQLSSENQLYQDQESYLAWVQTFYLGSRLSPGWLQLTDDLLFETQVEKQQEYAELMAVIGQLIGAEWAQDNSVRLIDTRSAGVWRDALLEAVYLGDLENYLQRFEADVNAILAGELNKEVIQLSRYYEEEKFELF